MDGTAETVTRRRLLRAVAGTSAAGVAGLAGCGGGGRAVRLQFVGVRARVGAIVVIADMGNGADDLVPARVHAQIRVGEGEGARTRRRAKFVTLPARQNTSVRVEFDTDDANNPMATGDPVTATVWVTFPESDRPRIDNRTCDECLQ